MTKLQGSTTKKQFAMSNTSLQRLGIGHWTLVLLWSLVLGSWSFAQHAPPPPPPPHIGPSPLLYVRFVGPSGARVAVDSGIGFVREFQLPVTVGYRPGYIYRFALSGFSDQPDAVLYPTLEVRGTLQLPPKQRAVDYPAPIELTLDDIQQALAGALITKVIYLECPDLAVPQATSPDQMLETNLRPGDDALCEARKLGRPMGVLRIGGRTFTPEEMARAAIPGTVLLPGDHVIGPPAAKPVLAWAGCPIYDPYHGPKPATEECLHDGGDIGLPAGIDANGKLNGLDPSDTVAQYKDCQGHTHISPSNRICLCVPRYAALRIVTPPAGYESTLVLAAAKCVQENVQKKCVLPSLESKCKEQLAGLRGRERPSAALATLGPSPILQLQVLRGYEMEIGPGAALCTTELKKLTLEQRACLKKCVELAALLSQAAGTHTVGQTEICSVVGQVNGVRVVTALQETRDYTCVCCDQPHVPDKPLALCKWTNVTTAQIGDVVTFYIKYSNQGGQPISDIVVSDNLTGRLEYMPGSAKTNHDAVFTMQQNEAGSLILRWEVQGRLLPAESGVVSFQAKIR
jgi:uncharacterized repeat protein (TIGR01451 family)